MDELHKEWFTVELQNASRTSWVVIQSFDNSDMAKILFDNLTLSQQEVRLIEHSWGAHFVP